MRHRKSPLTPLGPAVTRPRVRKSIRPSSYVLGRLQVLYAQQLRKTGGCGVLGALSLSFRIGTLVFIIAFTLVPSSPSAQTDSPAAPENSLSSRATPPQDSDRRYLIGDVGSVALVQYYADGFDKLTPRERLLAYYLAEAGIAGDPIYYDQISPYGLELKQLLEGIWTHPAGIEPATLEKIRRYTQLVWFYHGNYDADSVRKFLPEFTSDELRAAARLAFRSHANFGVKDVKSLDALLARLQKPIFDPAYRPAVTVKNPPAGEDIITASGSNLYEHVTLADVEEFKGKYGLNSRVVKRGGRIFEEIWRAGTPDGSVPPGRYAVYIRRIIANLEKAADVAEPAQADVIRKLIRYYQTGEKSDWYAYNIAWVKASTTVDAINGFVEQYLDPRSEKGAYESVVSFVDAGQTKLMRDFAANAQYFEGRAPWRDEFKKQNVHPPVANVITVVSEAGDGGPNSAAGINLPNEQDIRQRYGSKSVLLFNLTNAFAEAVGEKAINEFSATAVEKGRAKKYGMAARRLMVAMHEVLGHGSGKMSDKLTGDPRSYLKEYYSALEEARADLVALWNFADPKLTELGVADQQEIMRAAYDAEARNGLVILFRYPEGEQIEEDHDRGTQMITTYLRERFNCIEPVTQDGKVFLRVTDYEKMHQGVGELLAELMRIKAEGDYDGMKKLMDTYGVKLNTQWRDDVQRRASAIHLPKRAAFISPLLEPVRDAAGKTTDARIRYTHDFAEVMLTFSRKSLGYLPPK
jgi:dipeptidyl-peptidase-3